MSSRQGLIDATHLIIKVTCPFLLIVGTFGNVMTIIVFLRLNDYSSMSTFYMALALSDLVLLYSGGMTYHWLYYQFNVDIFNVHTIFCKLSTALPYMSSALSSWYLAVMTTQRAMSVVWPHRVNVICTRQFSVVITVIIAVVIIAIYSHLLYGFLIPRDTSMNSSCAISVCGPINSDYHYFFTHVLTGIDLFIGSLCPFVLLLVSNIVLVREVLTSVRNIRHRLAVGQSIHVTARESQASSLSVTLIALSVLFLLLTGPLRVQMIVFPYVNLQYLDLQAIYFSLIYYVLYTLFSANSAVNFYLYCLTGMRFRKEVLRLLCNVKTFKSERTMTNF